MTSQVVSAHQRPAIESPRRFGVRSLALLQIVLPAAVCVALWPTMQSLMVEWENTDNATYTHGYLIVAIAAWLLYRNRDHLNAYRARPEPLGMLLIVLLSFAWLVALRAGLQTVHQMLLPLIAWGAILAAFGRHIASRSVLPFAYLYFAIPVWGAINGLLQQGTVVAVEILLRISGIPALVEGNMVELAAGKFEVAGGCSGMHFFIVAIAIAVLYGEVNRDALKTRIRLVLLAIALALLTNWLRVYSIILAGYLTDMQHYLVRVEHYRFGWVVFAVCMIAFFLIARRFPANAKTDQTANGEPTPNGRTLAVGLTCAIASFSIAPIWNLASPVAPAADLEPRALLPSTLDDWVGPRSSPKSDWQPVFVGADRSEMGLYQHIHSSALVEMFAAVYAKQTQGKELVGYGNSISGEGYDGAQTRVDRNIDVAEVMGSLHGRSWLIWYYYEIDGLKTASELRAQIAYGMSSLRRNPLSSVVAVRIQCASDCAAERAHLADFMRALGRSANDGKVERGA